MIYKFLLVLLLSLSAYVHADTRAAISVPGSAVTPSQYSANSKSASTRDGACKLNAAWWLADTATNGPTGAVGSCWSYYVGYVQEAWIYVTACPAGSTQAGATCTSAATWSCPPNENWTLNGQTCSRPDCTGTRVMGTDGQCSCPAGTSDVGGVCTTTCPTGFHNQVPDGGQCIKDCAAAQKQGSDGVCTCDSKTFTTSASYTALNSRCVGGCSISWSAGMTNPVDAAKFIAGAIPASGVSVAAFVRQSGVTCESAPNFVNITLPPLAQDTSGKAADGTTPDPLNKPETNQSPEACAGVGGSYGVFNGVAKCLTDKGNAMQKLTTDVLQKVTTNADGSTSTKVDVAYAFRDPVTGEVKTKTESTTVEKNAAGTVTGSSGTVGEGQSRNSDLCSNNPGLQICKGGLNEEVTQKRVADALTVETKDYSDITGADTSPEVLAAKQSALDAVTGAITDLNKIGTAADPAKVYQDQVEAAMANWFDPIPASSCAPVGGTIGGRSFSIDICPTAAKISEIGAYCMWIMFAFGTFAMVTRKAE